MKADWGIKAFDACIEKRKAPTKLLSSSYQEKGLYPIVSQEKDLISGYWDNPDDLFVHRKPVVVFGDHTMVVKYIDFDFVVGADGVKILEPKEFLLPKYFFYWVSSVHIKSRGYARHFRYLREASVPIPSLPEQQRIVDILDREFAKIDALKANAEKSLHAAMDLFQATLKKELEPKEGWKVKTIGEVCEFQNGFAFKSSTFTDTGEPIIRISDIQNDEVIDTNVVFFNPSSYREDLSRFIVYPGDILIAMSGGTTGKLGMNNTQRCFYLNQRVGVFRENKALLNHEFLFHFLHTKSEESLRIAAGAAQPNLSTAQIKAFEIPVPSLQEQDRVVVRLNDLNDKCKALQDNYQKTLTLCDDLKQSLLRKAFNGEL